MCDGTHTLGQEHGRVNIGEMFTLACLDMCNGTASVVNSENPSFNNGKMPQMFTLSCSIFLASSAFVPPCPVVRKVQSADEIMNRFLSYKNRKDIRQPAIVLAKYST